jgi:hypothetical protein
MTQQVTKYENFKNHFCGCGTCVIGMSFLLFLFFFFYIFIWELEAIITYVELLYFFFLFVGTF